MGIQHRLDEEALYTALDLAADDGDLEAGRRHAAVLFKGGVRGGTVEHVEAACYLYAQFFPDDVEHQRSEMLSQIIDRELVVLLSGARINLADYLRGKGVAHRITPAVFARAARARHLVVRGVAPTSEVTSGVARDVYTEAERGILDEALDSVLRAFPA